MWHLSIISNIEQQKMMFCRQWHLTVLDVISDLHCIPPSVSSQAISNSPAPRLLLHICSATYLQRMLTFMLCPPLLRLYILTSITTSVYRKDSWQVAILWRLMYVAETIVE